jgi:precorrin-2 dehydrogenase/sirohydrochlorin ferrochelatase
MLFPVLLDLTGRLAVVIGGGAVGRRKARGLLAAGAHVRLVCREPRPLEFDSPQMEWRTEAYQSQHLDGAALVFAAAPPEINRQVIADARSRGLWVNVADEPGHGDFHLPAVVRRGDFLLAVSTGGASPALARAVRARLEAEFDDVFGRWVALLAEMRPLVRARIADAAQRRALFERLCAWEWLDRLRRDGDAAVRAEVLALVQAAERSL